MGGFETCVFVRYDSRPRPFKYQKNHSAGGYKKTCRNARALPAGEKVEGGRRDPFENRKSGIPSARYRNRPDSRENLACPAPLSTRFHRTPKGTVLHEFLLARYA